MDRYKIALKKKPSEEPKPIVESFGFEGVEHELNDRADFNRRRPLHCEPGARVGRVGIIAEDLEHIFIAGQAHFFNRAYVLCDHGDCCKIEKPMQRIACCLVIYDQVNMDDSRIVPWVFGRIVYNKLKEINGFCRLDQNDFHLGRSSEGPYHVWEPRVVADPTSLWQNHAPEQYKSRLLRRVSTITEHLSEYIGRPMTAEDLTVASTTPRANPYNRSFRQQAERSIRGTGALPPPTRPRRQQASNDPDIDNIFDDIFRDL